MSIYRMDCASAAQRLLKSGLPATIEHGAKRHGGGGEAAVVAEATQHFITAMDVLKLGLHEVDQARRGREAASGGTYQLRLTLPARSLPPSCQVAPPLSDLHASLHRVPQLPPDFEGKAVVRQWVATLGRLRAADRLDDATARQARGARGAAAARAGWG